MSINIRDAWNSNVKVLIWLHEAKIWRKTNVMGMGTDSIIVYIKTKEFYEDTAKDVKARFDTSNWWIRQTYLKGKIQK